VQYWCEVHHVDSGNPCFAVPLDVADSDPFALSLANVPELQDANYLYTHRRGLSAQFAAWMQRHDGDPGTSLGRL
jgi:hypothetical protein